MEVTFNCPHCNESLSADATSAGEQAPCPSCNNTFTVPRQAPKQPIGVAHQTHFATPPISQFPVTSQLAGWSLGLGIASMLLFGPLTGIPAIICGHMARSNIRKAPHAFAGAGMALAGLITGYIATVMSLIIGMFFISSALGGSSVAPFIYTLF